MLFFGKRVSNFKKKLKGFNINKNLIFWFFFNQYKYCFWSLENGFLYASQLEAMRRVITKLTRRKVKYLIKIKPVFLYRKKKKSMRMGRGLGKFFAFFFPIQKGVIFFELFFIKKIFLQISILKKAIKKLPIKVIIGKGTLFFYWKKYWFFYTQSL